MYTQLNFLDISIIFAFIAFILWWALSHGKNNDAESYFLAGKSQSWWIIGLSLFAASISTSTLIGHSGEGFISGVAVYNYNVGAILIIVFIALFFLPFYLKSGIYTIPEYLGRRYDNRSRRYFSLITILGNVFLDAAATLYTGALILKMMFPQIDMMWVIIGMAAMAGVYTIIGGLASVINADMIQSVVLLIGSVILSFLCFREIGGWDEFYNRFNEGVWLELMRSNSDTTVPLFAIFLSLPILSFYFWGNNQVMVQRVLSARTLNEGRLGLLLVGAIYIFTLFIYITPGMIARAIDLFGVGDILPDRIISGSELRETYGIDTNEVYPRLILRLLPNGLIGLIIATMISALTSTLSATLNSVSTLFTMDFYRYWKKDVSDKGQVRIGQITTFVVLVIAVLWAPLIGRFASLVAYYQEFVSYLAPPVVATFILGMFWKRSNAHGAFWGLMSGFVTAMVVMALKFGMDYKFDFHYLLWVPILFSLSCLINIFISLITEKPDLSKITGYTWNIQLWREESLALKGVKWYANFRILSVLLIVSMLFMYFMF